MSADGLTTAFVRGISSRYIFLFIHVIQIQHDEEEAIANLSLLFLTLIITTIYAHCPLVVSESCYNENSNSFLMLGCEHRLSSKLPNALLKRMYLLKTMD